MALSQFSFVRGAFDLIRRSAPIAAAAVGGPGEHSRPAVFATFIYYLI